MIIKSNVINTSNMILTASKPNLANLDCFGCDAKYASTKGMP